MNSQFFQQNSQNGQNCSSNNYQVPTDNYPINYFPPIIRNAIIQVAKEFDLPLGLFADSALATISLACQDKINVRRYKGLECPVSLFIFPISNKGEGKSTAYKPFIKFISEFLSKKTTESEGLNKKFIAERSRWEDDLKGIKAARILARQKSLPLDELDAKHDEIIFREPVKPREINLFLENSTATELLNSLNSDSPSAIIITQDSGTVFDNGVLQKLANLNKLWDGSDIHFSRSEVRYTLKNSRLSLFVMTQLNVLEDYLKGKGSLALGNGFLDRCLISQPESTVSQILGSAALHDHSDQHLNIFGNRLLEILNTQSTVPPIMLELSSEANAQLIAHYDFIRSQLRSQDSSSTLSQQTIRMPEISARLAALFHFFSGEQGLISQSCVSNAIEIARWYQYQFYIFQWQQQQKHIKPVKISALAVTPKVNRFPNKISKDELHANKLEDFLKSLNTRMPGRTSIRLKYIEENIGYPLKRSEIHRINAIRFLSNLNKIAVVKYNNEIYLCLNPQFFYIPDFDNGDNHLSQIDAVLLKPDQFNLYSI